MAPVLKHTKNYANHFRHISISKMPAVKHNGPVLLAQPVT